jgi:putative peptidoglycan lipid II flippase
MTGVMVLSGWCLGVQNAHRRFFMAYASAALWSVAQIVVLLLAGPHARDLVELAWWLSWATLGGAVLQVAAQVPQVWRLLGTIRPSFTLAVEGLGASLRNYVPAVAAIGLFQISGLIDLSIAYMLPEGSVASLGYASQVYLLPLSLFGVATAASALPELARLRTRGETDAVLSGVGRAWERVLFYTIPSSVAFLGIGDVIVGLVFRTGAFGADEQRVVAFILAGYALGLVAYASARVLTSTFHAMQDYGTPLRAAATSIVVSAVGALALSLPFRGYVEAAAGIAAGSAAGAFVNLGMLWRSAGRRLGPIDLRGPVRVFQRATVASVAALGVALGVRYLLRGAPVQVAAAAVIPAFSLVYVSVAIALGLDDATRLVQSVRRRLGGT